MHLNHIILALGAIVLVGFGAQQFFSLPMKAEAEIFPPIGMNVLQMHHDADIQTLPVQKLHDMTFVFSE
jgi:hypothetical protein